MTLPPSLPHRCPFPQWQRNQIVVTISASLIFAGFTLVMPFLPLYIQMLGVQSHSQVAIWAGAVLGVSPLLASMIGPLWGRIADRYGLKIMAIRISLALFLIWFFTGFAQNVYHLFFLRILLGVFGGFNTFSISLITQLCPPERIGRAIGSLQATQILSAAIGPFIGGILAGWMGIRNTFFVTSFMCFLSFWLFILFYKDRPAPAKAFSSKARGDRPPGSFKRLMRLPNFTVLAVLLFTITMIDRSFAPVIPLFVARFTRNAMQAARMAGITISLAAFAESFSAWYSGRVILKVLPKRFLLLRLAFGGLVSLALSFAGSVSQLLWLRVLLALLAGGTLTIAYTLASHVIPENERAAAFGLLSSFAMLGSAVGPLVGGMMASFNIRMVFIADTLFYGVLFGLVFRRVQRPEFLVPAQASAEGSISPTQEL